MNNMVDGFRIANGFSRLIDYIQKDNVGMLIPVFIAAVAKNEPNRTSLAPFLPNLLKQSLPETPDISQIQSMVSITDLMGICSQDTQVCQLLSQQTLDNWTLRFGNSLLTVLTLQKSSLKQSTHVYYALLCISNMMSLRKGLESLFRVYKVDLGQLLTSLAKNMSLERIEGHSKSFLDVSSTCLHVILANDLPKKSDALNHAMHDLCQSLFSVMTESDSPPSDDLLSILHNLFIYLDHSIPDLIVQFSIPFYLYTLYHSDPLKYGICLYIIAKLSKSHSRQIAQSVDMDWTDEELKKVILSKLPKVSKSGLQILACWLQASESHVVHWMKQSGFELLVWILRNENSKATMDGYIVGNAALCLGECCRKGKIFKNLKKF